MDKDKSSEKKRKFLKYKEGDIEYIREDDLELKEVLDEKGKDLKNKLKAFSIKDYLVFMLVAFLIGGPMLFYSYYLKPEKHPINQEVVGENKKTKETKTGEESKEKNTGKDIREEKGITVEILEAEVLNELAKINNRNVDKLDSYFNKKSNRAGLKSVLEKSLREQKDLYVKVESYMNEHKKESLLSLQETIFVDIGVTQSLIDMTKETISKDRVKEIYSIIK